MTINKYAYNDIAIPLMVIASRISRKIRINEKLGELQWVKVDGCNYKSLPIWRCDSFSVNILSDAYYIAVDNLGNHIESIDVDIEPTHDESRVFDVEYEGCQCRLADLYDAISKDRQKYGIIFNADWPECANYDE